ncbi:MAG: hypothetical protein ABI835_05575, partial [Chloroflexota bacterium]
MISSVESSFPARLKTIPIAELRYLLETLKAQLPVDLACICEYNPASKETDSIASLRSILTESFGTLSKAESVRLGDQLATQIMGVLPLDESRIIALEALDDAAPLTALVCPFHETTGNHASQVYTGLTTAQFMAQPSILTSANDVTVQHP